MSDRNRLLCRAALCCLTLILPLALTGCFSTTTTKYTRYTVVKRSQQDWGQRPAGVSNAPLVNQLMKTAFSQIGNPYRYGGVSPETGFDCSGFVQWVYGQYGFKLPRTTRDLLSVGVPVARGDLKPGDILFFYTGISHVGIYTGDNKYIHSPRTGKRIQENDLSETGRGNKYVTARRIIRNPGVTTIDEGLKNAWVRDSRQQLAKARGTAVVKRQAAEKKTKRTAKATRHTVKAGDTVYDIARRYGVSQEDLVKANKLGRNKNQLKLGQTLVVPKKNN